MPGSNRAGEFPSDPEARDPAFVSLVDVSKTFGSIEAVRNVSFSLDGGKILGVVGSDGAGKTTLLRMMSTMLRPTEGVIRVKNLDVVSQRERAKELIGYMPQRFGLYQDLTVSENLDFVMDIYGISGAERKERRQLYLGFSNLLPYVDRKAGDLSGGMKQKLGLACVLVHEPRLLILDEPTNGVDPVSRKEFWDILFDMKSRGMTIVTSTAYLDEGEKCDRIILMHDSRLLQEASPEEMRTGFPDLEEAIIYLIGEADASLAEDSFGN
jgi:ABC-2 type transport system ATP-binding protein